MVKKFKYIGRPTLLLALAAAVAGVVFSFIVAWTFHQKEQTFVARQFRHDVVEQVRSIERQVQLELESLYTFKMLFEVSEEVTEAEFAQAATDTLERHSDLESIYWLTASDRELRGLKWVYGHLRESAQPLRPALDPDSDLREMLKGFCSCRTIVARLLAPSRESDRPPLYVAAMPVSCKSPDKAGEPVGFVLAAFRIEALVADALNQTVASRVNFTLRDGTDDFPILYRRQLTALSEGKPTHEYRGTLLPFAGRQWHVQATPTPYYLTERSSIQPQVIFFAGTGMVALATGLFLILLRHSRIAERMVAARTRELKRLNDKLERLSQIDKLTGVANRRFFDEHFALEWNRCLRSARPLALIMIDIDHFKLYNDFYGHLEGDACLRTVARCLEKTLKRPGDLLARYGGEEFACVLPETGREGRAVAETLRAAVENLGLPAPTPDGECIMTVSVGFSFVTPSGQVTGDDLLKAADRALYRAKQAGRNRVAKIDAQLPGESPDNA